MNKNILLWLLAILINDVNSVEPPDLTLVFNKNSTKHFCIAEGNVLDSGIGWIFPISDNLPEIVTNYEPKIESDYNCDFSKKDCINLWHMEDWQYSSYNSHDLKPTLDSRWDNFETILTNNNTKDFVEKTKIPSTFHIGISIRAKKNAEVLLCEGFDPLTYPCYYINIGGNVDGKQAFLRKYKSIPETMSKNDTKLKKYKSDTPILSEMEWKNFAISLNSNGTLSVLNVYNKSVILNYTDTKPLKPIYLMVRSSLNRALWKVHNNHYTFTNKTILTQMGPSFSIYGHSLCISLYVSMCKSCKMTFYLLVNEEKKVLKEVSGKNDDLSWRKIKIVSKNVYQNKLKVFIETKYSNSSARNGFWAIDDVAICAENEIKVSQLLANSSGNSSEMADVSCQALDFPAWRPEQHTILSTVPEEMNSTLLKNTSIRLTWKKPLKLQDNVGRFYLAQYEGADICKYSQAQNAPINIHRRKSQGYVISKNNNIVIKDLVPFTLYNITLFNILEENKQTLQRNTLPTEIPTKEEIPKNVTMVTTDTTCQMKWDKIRCNESYGKINHRLILKDLSTNESKVFLGVTNGYHFTNLTAFNAYNVEITTARELANINFTNSTIKTVYKFRTSPGVAPPVENFELYMTSKNSASFRYDLPKYQRGISKQIQIRSCTPLLQDTCNTDIRDIKKCVLWRSKYCFEIKNLTRDGEYTFKLSVKNDETHIFGQESQLKERIFERVPGKPENLSYEMVHCQKHLNFCDLNITWTHPSVSGGSITMFRILLREHTFSDITDASRNINEIFKVRRYQPTYSYMVKYLLKNVVYNISVKSVNDRYGSNYTSIITEMDTTIDFYVDKTPKYLNSTNETITFQLPNLDWRFNSSTLIVFAQDYVNTKTIINEDIRNLKIFDNDNRLCNHSGNVWIAHSVKITEESSPIVVIGDNSLSDIPQLKKTIINMALKPNSEYCFTFALVQENGDENDLQIFHEQHLFTQPNERVADYQNTAEKIISPAAYLVPVLIIILLAALGAWFGYRHLRKKNFCRSNTDHVYESMPFDDYIAGSFSNDTYDKLVHD